ncbi:uncharacterized protein TrAtP1_012370 [Trichoderma atroviride]|uniref:Uncharacterized protein n=1 Tax=Hypocrea atroviridis (strain ATCC 20476 / IMI 206040) TaxID=452589 RepID=G9NPP4_HYPAI|nr:uncharacterized protein TRIATDRAFT_306238 [Trichoderma atroviride IMI 206040]EHK47510.1 hypothetical protein TRIATDRAFT_306238 [Trichoderma atroviride IMI 206040]UKZ71411.1 hypothetical protein TrAtP1_012370 [Trichoderma atroviride]
MPSDQGGAIFIDVSLGQRDEPGRMQVSHQQAHHSAGNTWEKGLIYVAPTCQSTEHIVPACRLVGCSPRPGQAVNRPPCVPNDEHVVSPLQPIAGVPSDKIPTRLGLVLSRSPSDLAPTLRDRQVPIVALLVPVYERPGASLEPSR